MHWAYGMTSLRTLGNSINGWRLMVFWWVWYTGIIHSQFCSLPANCENSSLENSEGCKDWEAIDDESDYDNDTEENHNPIKGPEKIKSFHGLSRPEGNEVSEGNRRKSESALGKKMPRSYSPRGEFSSYFSRRGFPKYGRSWQKKHRVLYLFCFMRMPYGVLLWFRSVATLFDSFFTFLSMVTAAKCKLVLSRAC